MTLFCCPPASPQRRGGGFIADRQTNKPICYALSVPVGTWAGQFPDSGNGRFRPYGIRVTPAQNRERMKELTERVHEAELEAVRLRGLVEKQDAILRIQKKNGVVIAAISLVAIAALLIRYLVFDHSVPTAGLIIGGEATLGAWLLVGGVFAVAIILGKLLLDMAMRNTPKLEEGEKK